MNDPGIADVIAGVAAGASEAARHLGEDGVAVCLEDFSVEVTTGADGVTCAVRVALIPDMRIQTPSR